MIFTVWIRPATVSVHSRWPLDPTSCWHLAIEAHEAAAPLQLLVPPSCRERQTDRHTQTHRHTLPLLHPLPCCLGFPWPPSRQPLCGLVLRHTHMHTHTYAPNSLELTFCGSLTAKRVFCLCFQVFFSCLGLGKKTGLFGDVI